MLLEDFAIYDLKSTIPNIPLRTLRLVGWDCDVIQWVDFGGTRMAQASKSEL